ncbi:hypothetical protein [Coleofasciculus sp. FACHB-501]|uniref:hypothetical protein n=1 Tax=Cyanophyceae TaxID=3028117 RepID=UPI0016868B9D|nr:hypothetical protein [Coleofasciculus sp. FACHB-501]MBD1839581.1 hypothetical protein [Coleofasciculus sp. FACHB-501]
MSINLDEPLMSQQAVRDFLKLPFEEAVPKIGLHDLLEVAKVVVRNELVSCGCLENELIGCRIECQVSQVDNPKLGEVYLTEWSQLPQEVAENNEETVEAQPEVNLVEQPVSDEFIGKLITRLAEATVNSKLLAASQGQALRFSTQINFRSGNSIHYLESCDPKCPRLSNGLMQNSLFSFENGKYVRKKSCIGTPCWIPPSQDDL